MANPINFLANISKLANSIFLWTHYYNDQHKNVGIFTEEEVIKFSSNNFVLHKQFYNGSLQSKKFLGGNKPFSSWLERDAIIDILHAVGFSNLQIAFDDVTHLNGSSFCILAQKFFPKR